MSQGSGEPPPRVDPAGSHQDQDDGYIQEPHVPAEYGSGTAREQVGQKPAQRERLDLTRSDSI
jgi:hypothetical protein